MNSLLNGENLTLMLQVSNSSSTSDVSRRDAGETHFTTESKRDEVKTRPMINNYMFNPNIIALDLDVKRGGAIGRPLGRA
jgi:hypothetical protein